MWWKSRETGWQIHQEWQTVLLRTLNKNKLYITFILLKHYVFQQQFEVLDSAVHYINVCSRYRPGLAQRVGRGIALLFHDPGARRREWSAAHPGRTLSPGKTLYPFYRRLGGPRAGPDGLKISPHRESIPDPPARSQWLYRLSYLAHAVHYVMKYNGREEKISHFK